MSATYATHEPRVGSQPTHSGERLRKVLPACVILYAAIPLVVALRTK